MTLQCTAYQCQISSHLKTSNDVTFSNIMRLYFLNRSFLHRCSWFSIKTALNLTFDWGQKVWGACNKPYCWNPKVCLNFALVYGFQREPHFTQLYVTLETWVYRHTSIGKRVYWKSKFVFCVKKSIHATKILSKNYLVWSISEIHSKFV